MDAERRNDGHEKIGGVGRYRPKIEDNYHIVETKRIRKRTANCWLSVYCILKKQRSPFWSSRPFTRLACEPHSCSSAATLGAPRTWRFYNIAFLLDGLHRVASYSKHVPTECWSREVYQESIKTTDRTGSCLWSSLLLYSNSVLTFFISSNNLMTPCSVHKCCRH